MELGYLSSEELSEYSIVCCPPCSNYADTNCYDNSPEEAKIFSGCTVQSQKQLKSISQPNKSGENTEAIDQHESKKCAIKINSKDCEKNTLKVSARKLKLADRQDEIGSLSTSPTASRNLFCPRKEYCQLLNKKRENDCGKSTLMEEVSGVVKSGKKREIMEIEVFMPFVDVDKNKIIYPESTKPNVKRYFANENIDLKPKKNTRQNMYLKKRSGENNGGKYLHSKVKKDVPGNLNKNTSKTRRKSSEANTVKSSLMKRKSSEKDLKLPTSGDLERGEKGFEFQNSLRNTANEIECSSAYERTNTSSVKNENSLKSKFLTESVEDKKKNHSSKHNFINIHELIHQPAEKLPTKAAYSHTRFKNGSACFVNSQECAKENTQVNIKKKSKMRKSQERKKKKASSSMDINTNERKVYIRLSPKEQVHGIEKSNSSSVNKTSSKINENGWRKGVFVNSSRGHLGADKWRRKTREDRLSMESWIERNKYLQIRDKNLQEANQRNPWCRTS